MIQSSRFIIGTHVMIILAISRGRLVDSDFLAFSINTNPVVVRRILSQLRAAGLVASRPGRHGGVEIALNPEKISLFEIYTALEQGPLVHRYYSPPNQNCPVGYTICDVLEPFLEQAEQAFFAQLKEINIAMLAEQIAETSGINEMLSQGISVEALQRDYRYENGKFIFKGENHD